MMNWIWRWGLRMRGRIKKRLYSKQLNGFWNLLSALTTYLPVLQYWVPTQACEPASPPEHISYTTLRVFVVVLNEVRPNLPSRVPYGRHSVNFGTLISLRKHHGILGFLIGSYRVVTDTIYQNIHHVLHLKANRLDTKSWIRTLAVVGLDEPP